MHAVAGLPHSCSRPMWYGLAPRLGLSHNNCPVMMTPGTVPAYNAQQQAFGLGPRTSCLQGRAALHDQQQLATCQAGRQHSGQVSVSAVYANTRHYHARSKFSRPRGLTTNMLQQQNIQLPVVTRQPEQLSLPAATTVTSSLCHQAVSGKH